MQNISTGLLNKKLRVHVVGHKIRPTMSAFSFYQPVVGEFDFFSLPLKMTLDGIMGGGKSVILQNLQKVIGRKHDFKFLADPINIERQWSSTEDLLDMIHQESLGLIEKILLDACADRYLKMYYRVSGWDSCSNSRYLCNHLVTERSIYSFLPFIQTCYQCGLISKFCFEWLKKCAEKYQNESKLSPCFVIFLDMPVEKAWSKYHAKNPNTKLNEFFFQQLRQNLLDHYNRNRKPICMINVNGDIDKDFAKVYRCIKQLCLAAKWFPRTPDLWLDKWDDYLHQRITRRFKRSQSY